MNDFDKIIQMISELFSKKHQNNQSFDEFEQDTPKHKKKVSFKSVLPLIVILAIVFVANTCTFIVGETEQAIVSRFNEIKIVIVEEKTPELIEDIQSNPKYEDVKIIERKGIFFKVPFIDTVEKYTSQLLTYNTMTREVTTRDKKKIVLDNNAQWKITNPLLFKIGARNIASANTKLDDIIYSKLNEKIGLTEGSQLISDKEYVYNMLSQVRNNTNKELRNIGIEVVDVRIAKTEFPKENYENIFNRMRTERQKIANKFRSEGEEEYQKIIAKAEKQATIIRADAYEKSQILRGEGDALAAEIYAGAYNKDPEFYEFYKTLTTYQKTLDEGTTIVIDSDSGFAKYLFGNN